MLWPIPRVVNGGGRIERDTAGVALGRGRAAGRAGPPRPPLGVCRWRSPAVGWEAWLVLFAAAASWKRVFTRGAGGRPVRVVGC